MAQVSILVKPEGAVTKGLDIVTTPIWGIGKKLKSTYQAFIKIDDEGHMLEASAEPHIIKVKPGKHSISAVDPKGGKKLGINSAVKAAVFTGIKLTGGGSITEGIANGINSARTSQEEAAAKYSYDEFEISEGETVEYTCQPTSQGIIKIKRTR